MLRSETVDKYKIIIPKENAWEVLNELGMIGNVEFVTPEGHGNEREKQYHRMSKHAEEIMRQMSTIHEFLSEQKAEIRGCHNYDRYLSNIGRILRNSGHGHRSYFNHVGETVRQFAEDIAKHSNAMNKLVDDLTRAEEELVVNNTLRASLPENYV